MKIKRWLEDKILTQLDESSKGIVIYGPRQAGKTTLVNDILAKKHWKTLILNGDRRGNWWSVITSRELPKIKLMIEGYQALFVDEAQRIPEIGLSLKIILDEFPDLKVIVTGSSSLDLASRISEPLTGRIYTQRLYPISFAELEKMNTPFELQEGLEERMIYGSYPELFSLSDAQAKTEYLSNLTDNYLYKDLLEFGGIRNSNKIRDLLKLLAFQVGSQVSVSELANNLGLSRMAVDRYIDLLEKSYVIFRLGGFSRNLRKEVFKMNKIYFYDLGVRNTIIGNLNFLENRDDVGGIWENFLMIERIKRQEYTNKLYSRYFWRLSSGPEVDLIEEEAGKLAGFEFKYTHKRVRPPKSWLESYQNSTYQVIDRDNYLEFITD